MRTEGGHTGLRTQARIKRQQFPWLGSARHQREFMETHTYCHFSSTIEFCKTKEEQAGLATTDTGNPEIRSPPPRTPQRQRTLADEVSASDRTSTCTTVKQFRLLQATAVSCRGRLPR